MKRILKWLGAALLGLVLLAAIVPLLVPVRPLDGLLPPGDLAGPDSQFVTLPFAGTDGIDIHYVDKGPREAERVVILLHGSVFNLSTWDRVIDRFAARGRVIAYDQAPFGLSEKPVSGDWTAGSPLDPAANIARVIQLMDALSVERATLVGNSYGAVLAVRTADAHPDRVAALVLGNPAVYVDESLPEWVMDLPQVTRLGPLLARAIGGSEAFIASTWANPDRMPAERMAKTLVHTKVENWDLGLWSYLHEWRTPDLSPVIARLAPPLLVVSGTEDNIVPIADSRRLHDAVPGSALHLLPNCGHVPQEECPEAYAEAVFNWLDGLE